MKVLIEEGSTLIAIEDTSTTVEECCVVRVFLTTEQERQRFDFGLTSKNALEFAKTLEILAEQRLKEDDELSDQAVMDYKFSDYYEPREP